MKETGIIMSGNHPQQIIDCLKTMTRRTWGLEKVNEHPDLWEYIGCFTSEDDGKVYHSFRNKHSKSVIINVKCPYGEIGDQLWVRETFAKRVDGVDQILYKADYTEVVKMLDLPNFDIRWKPSIHMFRKDSRIILVITGLRAERVQEITEADAIAEGCIETRERIGNGIHWESPRGNFCLLWNSLNAKRGSGFDFNPWVWPIEFNAIGVKLK